MTSYIEITTKIGCPIACLKYCPQEKMVPYKGDQILTLSMFRAYFKTIPPSVCIKFGGNSEPFINQECTDMVLHANEKGHKIIITTTLVGLTPEDAIKLTKIPFEMFMIHLPDSFGNAHIDMTAEYFEVFRIILKGVENVGFMSMNGLFKTNESEFIFRKTAVKRHGRRYCGAGFMDEPGYYLMPNGDVYFCCITKGLAGRVGSLKSETYADLVAKHRHMGKQLANDSDSLCHYCAWSLSSRALALRKFIGVCANISKRIGVGSFFK